MKTLPSQCVTCFCPITDNSVILQCSCLICICQSCAKIQIAGRGGTYNSLIKCPVCLFPTNTCNLIEGVKEAVAQENFLISRACAFFEIRVPKKNQLFEPLIEHFAELLANDPYTVSKIKEAHDTESDMLRLLLAQLECHRYGDFQKSDPMNFIRFKSNKILEKSIAICSGLADCDLSESCIVCSELITKGNSIQFFCHCTVNIICQDCALHTIANQENTFHEGIMCPTCRQPSFVIDKVDDARKYEFKLINEAMKALGYKNLKGRSKNIDFLHKLYVDYWDRGYKGNINPNHHLTETPGLSKRCTVPIMRMEIARLELLRASGGVNNRDISNPHKFLGPLSVVRVQRNRFLEVFLGGLQRLNASPQDLRRFSQQPVSTHVWLDSREAGSGSEDERDDDHTTRYSQLSDLMLRESTLCPYCETNPQSRAYLHKHITNFHPEYAQRNPFEATRPQQQYQQQQQQQQQIIDHRHSDNEKVAAPPVQYRTFMKRRATPVIVVDDEDEEEDEAPRRLATTEVLVEEDARVMRDTSQTHSQTISPTVDNTEQYAAANMEVEEEHLHTEAKHRWSAETEDSEPHITPPPAVAVDLPLPPSTPLPIRMAVEGEVLRGEEGEIVEDGMERDRVIPEADHVTQQRLIVPAVSYRSSDRDHRDVDRERDRDRDRRQNSHHDDRRYVPPELDRRHTETHHAYPPRQENTRKVQFLETVRERDVTDGLAPAPLSTIPTLGVMFKNMDEVVQMTAGRYNLSFAAPSGRGLLSEASFISNQPTGKWKFTLEMHLPQEVLEATVEQRKGFESYLRRRGEDVYYEATMEVYTPKTRVEFFSTLLTTQLEFKGKVDLYFSADRNRRHLLKKLTLGELNIKPNTTIRMEPTPSYLNYLKLAKEKRAEVVAAPPVSSGPSQQHYDRKHKGRMTNLEVARKRAEERATQLKEEAAKRQWEANRFCSLPNYYDEDEIHLDAVKKEISAEDKFKARRAHDERPVDKHSGMAYSTHRDEDDDEEDEVEHVHAPRRNVTAQLPFGLRQGVTTVQVVNEHDAVGQDRVNEERESEYGDDEEEEEDEGQGGEDDLGQQNEERDGDTSSEDDDEDRGRRRPSGLSVTDLTGRNIAQTGPRSFIRSTAMSFIPPPANQLSVAECPYVLVLQTNDPASLPFDTHQTELRFTVRVPDKPDVPIVVRDPLTSPLSTLVPILDRECGFKFLVAEFRSDTDKFLQRNRPFAEYNVRNNSVIELRPRTGENGLSSGSANKATAAVKREGDGAVGRPSAGVPYRATPIVLSRAKAPVAMKIKREREGDRLHSVTPLHIPSASQHFKPNSRHDDSPSPPRRANTGHTVAAVILPPRSTPHPPAVVVRSDGALDQPAPVMESEYDRLLNYGPEGSDEEGDSSDEEDAKRKRKRKMLQHLHQQQGGSKKCQKADERGGADTRAAAAPAAMTTTRRNYSEVPTSHGSNKSNERRVSSDEEVDRRSGATRETEGYTNKPSAVPVPPAAGGGFRGGQPVSERPVWSAANRTTYAPTKMYTPDGNQGGGAAKKKTGGKKKSKRRGFGGSDSSDDDSGGGSGDDGRPYWDR